MGWDTLDKPNWRALEFAAYQGGRQFDEELLEQLEVLPVFVHACGFVVGKAAGYEADDFLAAAAAVGESRGWTTLVASGDRDTFQLASDLTTILYPVKAGEIARIGPEEVRERYGVEPSQVPDFIALRGDPSDRIPGARGIGAQTAAKLLKHFSNVEEMIANGRFPTQAEDLQLYRRIAAMDATAPLPKISDRTPTWEIAAALAREWELKELAERLTRMEVPAP